MRQRLAARILLTDAIGSVLLFHFEHKTGVLAGMNYWATPGGGVEADETFEQAAIRELWEETGIRVADVGPQIAQRKEVYQSVAGEYGDEDERYFHVRVTDRHLSVAGWSAHEVECMTGYRWWSRAELLQTGEEIWPKDLLTMLDAIRVPDVPPDTPPGASSDIAG